MPFSIKPIENSSHLAGADYDPVSQTLRVEFKDGAQYDYPGVSFEMAQAFWSSSSQGQYLHGVIRQAHNGIKVG